MRTCVCVRARVREGGGKRCLTVAVLLTGDFRASLPFGLYTATVRAPHYVSPLATLKVDRSTVK